MYSSGNQIYRSDGNKIKKINIKYKNIEHIHFPSCGIVKHIHGNVFSNSKHACVLFDNREPYFLNNCKHKSIMNVKNYLISYQGSKFKPKYITVYDLDNKISKKIRNSNGYEVILESPSNEDGGTQILLKQGWKISMFDDINKCFSISKDLLSNDESICKWISNREFVIIYYSAWKYFLEVQFIDLISEFEKVVYISEYWLMMNANWIAVGNDVLYLWFNKRILAVNKMGATEINHHCNIEAYNQYNDLFVDSNLDLYKIYGNKLIKFNFEYNIWYDNDKPKQIHNIVMVFMDLDIFPKEIYNIIYPYLVHLYASN